MPTSADITLSAPPSHLSQYLTPSPDAIGLTVNPGYIKWFSPSLDYPCILSPYYLFFPIKIYLKPFPRLETAAEEGEKEHLLYSVKNQLLETILKRPRTFIT